MAGDVTAAEGCGNEPAFAVENNWIWHACSFSWWDRLEATVVDSGSPTGGRPHALKFVQSKLWCRNVVDTLVRSGFPRGWRTTYFKQRLPVEGNRRSFINRRFVDSTIF